MAGQDYVPDSDANFRTWAEAFSTNILADPFLFMLTSAQAVSIQASVQDFVSKLAVATNENTRTKATIIAKDDSRASCEALCRQYAVLIKNNAGISDDDKARIGVRPVNPNRERIDCPQTSPLINIIGNTPGSQTLRFADTNTPDSRARPFGASELQLWVAITTAEAASFADARFYGKFTRNPVSVEFAEGDDGKVATYYARWASLRGETGPLSLPVSMRIAA